MSDWHFGMDYDMWLYPPVDWTSPDYNYELPEPIEAANIEGTLLVNAEDAIEQVHHLQAENAKLHELVRDYYVFMFCDCYACRLYDECHGDGCEDRKPFCILPARLGKRTRELGVEVS